jgi:hypothetical protein
MEHFADPAKTAKGHNCLLHPAQAFAHPQEIVSDPDLSLEEKRAILAAWASDACAVEAAPALRRAPGSDRSVAIDDLLEALRTLDCQSSTLPGWARPQRSSGKKTLVRHEGPLRLARIHRARLH